MRRLVALITGNGTTNLQIGARCAVVKTVALSYPSGIEFMWAHTPEELRALRKAQLPEHKQVIYLLDGEKTSSLPSDCVTGVMWEYQVEQQKLYILNRRARAKHFLESKNKKNNRRRV